MTIKNKTNRIFIIGNGPSLQKMNLNVLQHEITIGVNAVLYNSFQPTYIAITDTVVINQYPVEILFGSEKSIYIFSRRIYRKYKNIIDKYISVDKIHLIDLINTDFMKSGVTFDKNFKKSHVSYSIMIDIAFPLAYYLRYPKVYLIGIDHSDYKHHCYDAFLKSLPANIPNPQNISGYNDAIQSEDLSKRYQKAYQILKKSGIEVFNAGLDSKLDVFTRMSWIELFPKGLKKTLPKELSDWTVFLNIKSVMYEFVIVCGSHNIVSSSYIRTIRLHVKDEQILLAAAPLTRKPFLKRVYGKNDLESLWIISSGERYENSVLLKKKDKSFYATLHSKSFPFVFLESSDSVV